MKNWLELIRDSNTDVLILNVDENLVTYLLLLKEIQYYPKVIMGLTRSIAVIRPRSLDVDNTYVYYASAFSEKVGYGYSNEQYAYMGSTDDFIKYVDNNYIKFYNSTVYPKASVDFNGDYEYIARGYNIYYYYDYRSLIGITIQRIVELASSVKKVNFSDSENFFNYKTFSNILNTIEKGFTVCEKEDGDIVQNCGILSCKTGCKSWKSFFGPVYFDETHMNRELKSTIHQIKSYQDYKTPNIVAPSTSPVCNMDNHICTANNGYKDCTCSSIYPCPYNWIKTETNKFYYINKSYLAIFYLFSIILSILDIFIIIFFIQNYKYIIVL